MNCPHECAACEGTNTMGCNASPDPTLCNDCFKDGQFAALQSELAAVKETQAKLVEALADVLSHIRTEPTMSGELRSVSIRDRVRACVSVRAAKGLLWEMEQEALVKPDAKPEAKEGA